MYSRGTEKASQQRRSDVQHAGDEQLLVCFGEAVMVEFQAAIT